jgi:hypothetical protein
MEMAMATEANPITFDFQAAVRGYHDNARARREARLALTVALEERAQAEHDYRKALAVAFTKLRAKGKAQVEAEIEAKADAAGFALKRDMADAKAKGMQARLAELEGERASLRQLLDWSRAVDGDAT